MQGLFKYISFTFFIAVTIPFWSIEPIVLNDSNLGNSFTKEAWIIEDKDFQLTINDLLYNERLPLKQCQHNIEKIDFTSSVFWLKFDIENESSYEEFLINVARVITDKVTLYEYHNYEIKQTYYGGDLTPYQQRSNNSINNTFSLKIPQNGKKHYILRLQSDGENIRLPIIINNTNDFHIAAKERVFLMGAYYGMLILFSFLYLFYYFGMKERSLLLYSLYVLSIFLLQFTLDGYSYYYIFRNMMFVQPYTVVFFAVLASFTFLIYVKAFLKIDASYKKLNTIYQWAFYVLAFNLVLNFIPGKSHVLSYPVVNLTSLGTLFLIAGSILYLRNKGIAICNYFTAAIFTLVIGAILFILTNFHIIESDFVFKNALKIGSALEILLLSLSMSNKLRELQKEKELAQEKALQNLTEKNKLIDQQNELLETQVKERTTELEIQKEQVLEKNKEIIDSINYAKRLQDAIIPPLEAVSTITKDAFVLFQPKDIVSGDFYWITETTTSYEDRQNSKRLLLTAADCTGHGVPGAFISIIGLNIFNQTLKERTVNDPAQALDFLNKQVYNTVNKHKGNDDIIRDGMDLAICSIDMNSLELEFAGAKNPLYIVRGSELIELKGDKQPIGFSDNVTPFTLQKFQLEKGDMVYASTDGYADQFGGPRGKKFKYKPFKDLLLSISKKHPEQQKNILKQRFDEWKGDLEQLDDVCVVGIRI
ncbi:MAG: SpoIIE family protein phosphatase [Flavobacteriales bacterium]|jgi:serine phosphatase RsbU (regulator of sigma subunit)|nr:SpoIIE family protein phosphatase [Flavobacteriales bacterium]